MATILGISAFYHDSAAAILKDGLCLGASAEERFSRVKHSKAFPSSAIEYCMEAAQLNSVKDIDAIVFYEKPSAKFFRQLDSYIQTWPRGLSHFTLQFPDFLTQKMNIRQVIRKELPGYGGDVLFSSHHQSHAAFSFYTSAFPTAAVVTADGVGELQTTTIGIGSESGLRNLRSIHFPDSLGLFYSTFASYLGFEVNDGEWKQMGLSAYGVPKYLDKLKQCIRLNTDGSFQLNREFFAFPYSSLTMFRRREFENLFGFPPRHRDDAIESHHADLASSVQSVLETALLAIAAEAKRLTGCENLVLGGGVALNGLANHRLRKSGLFKNIFIPPAPGDDGGALGAALAAHHLHFKGARSKALKTSFLGPATPKSEIKDFLVRNRIKFHELDEESVIREMAEALASGKVVGHFQGSAEFGPRALGNRSIFANPALANIKSILNEKIKYREAFRPFAPMTPLELAPEFFEVDAGLEYLFMSEVVSVREEKRHLIPGAVHEDGTARIQTVRSEDASRIHALLAEFGARSGVPILINTSFNLSGEPIVNTPAEAYKTFKNSGIDLLVIENYIIDDKQGGVTATQALSVSDFYQELPFNYYSNSVLAARRLHAENPVLEIPPIHRLAKERKGSLKFCELGCGTGWFVNALALHYGAEAVGVDRSAKAIEHARRVARAADTTDRVKFITADLRKFDALSNYDLVHCFGVLHSMENTHDALKEIMARMRVGAFLHVGFYHKYGRAPVLDHFQKMKDAGADEQTLFEEFQKLLPTEEDQTHSLSWFRDQILHPHESTHTAQEIQEIIEDCGFTAQSMSLNRFGKYPTPQRLDALERQQETIARKRLAAGKFFPGFFSIFAQKIN